MKQAIIYNIQHFSLHDGPGIRTTVFLKGCSLRCAWCHNPESIDGSKEMLFDAQKCIGCAACIHVCKTGAQEFGAQAMHRYNAALCNGCGNCAEVCYSGAMECCGQWKSDEEVLEEVLRDRQLYETSGGGVTFSGGEPLLQAEFLLALCSRLKEEKIHIAIDTALHVPWQSIQRLLPYVDLYLADFKLADTALHQKYIGAGNERIKENLQKLAQSKPIYIRIPVVGGVNDNMRNMQDTAEFLKSLGDGIRQVNLLSYHDLGIAKSRKLGREMQKFDTPTMEQMQQLAQPFLQWGIETLID